MISPPLAPSTCKPSPRTKIIMDSGAYSAWRSGHPVDLDDYCKYLEANHDWIDTYINLDHIGPGDPEAAAEKSFENLKIMRACGFKPMAVFHVGEDISWLHRMLDLGCDYIGLAGLSLKQRGKVKEWYAYCWAHLVSAEGLPLVKVHALGEGRIDNLLGFPWYSADSTSWIYNAQRNGGIMLPNGFELNMRHDKVSPRSSPDIDDLDPINQDIFETLLAETGLTRAALDIRGMEAWTIRGYLAAFWFRKLQDQVRARQPIRFYPQGFLPVRASAGAAIDPFTFDLYLVVSSPNKSNYPVMARVGHEALLTSYFYMNDKNTAAIKGYLADPVGYCAATPPYSDCWTVLETYLGH